MEKNKRGLSPRQIINRYKKGAYIDECADTISAAISAMNAKPECVAIPIQRHWIEEVIENIGICFQLSKERYKADELLEDISDERAKNLLLDLSTPDLWNAIMNDGDYINAIWRHDFKDKYPTPHAVRILETLFYMERERLESFGKPNVRLKIVLQFMVV